MSDLTIRTACRDDLDGVLEIVRYWSQVRGADRSERGYLRHSYTREGLSASVERGWCAVAVEGEHVVSVYLIHDGVSPEQIETRQALIDELMAEGRLPAGRYALTLVSATREGFSGRGLNRATFTQLRDQVADEFDFFVGIGSADNEATQRSAVRMGWHTVGRVEAGLLGVAATTEAGDARLRRMCGPRSDAEHE